MRFPSQLWPLSSSFFPLVFDQSSLGAPKQQNTVLEYWARISLTIVAMIKRFPRQGGEGAFRLVGLDAGLAENAMPKPRSKGKVYTSPQALASKQVGTYLHLFNGRQAVHLEPVKMLHNLLVCG